MPAFCQLFTVMIKVRMATGSGSSSLDLYECQICFHDMLERTPRYLRCHHSFCEECLTRLVKKGKITCPTCRKVTDILTTVQDLTINFHLAQMKEREEQLQSKEIVLCNLCRKWKAVNKCHDCNKLLCADCTERHNAMKQLDGHKMHILCAKHQEGLSHVCVKCAEEVCVTCMLSTHADHGDDIKEYAEGVNDLRREATEVKKKTEEEMARRKSLTSEVVNNIAKTKKMKKDIVQRISLYRERIAEYNQKIENASWSLHYIEKSCEQDGQQILTDCEDSIEALDKNRKTLTNLLRVRDREFLSMYKSQKESFNVKPEVNLAFYIAPTLHVIDEGDCYKKTVAEIVKYKHLATPKLVWTAKPSDKIKLQSPLTIAVQGTSGLLVSDFAEKAVFKLDTNGKLVDIYRPKNTEAAVKCVSYFDGYMYITQNEIITRLKEDMEDADIFKTSVKNIRSIHLVNGEKIIITESADPGRIFEYNTNEDKTKVVAENLKHPAYVATTETEKGRRYLVTIEDRHCIHIYDETWILETVIGKRGSKDGALMNPRGICLTPNNTLLV